MNRQLRNRVRAYRVEHGWSQDELARRAGVSRAAVSAIEIERLSPSVDAALGLAAALGCRVEDLFTFADAGGDEPAWAWPPPVDPCRYWKARVRDRDMVIPAEATAAGTIAHDGVFSRGQFHDHGESLTSSTLVMASCDPAAGLLCGEYARQTGNRLIVLPRSSQRGLDLLGRGLVDVAGIHLATAKNDGGNGRAVAASLAGGYSLLKVARWQEGVTLAPGTAADSVAGAVKAKLRWVGREPGSGARLCQDEILGDRPVPKRMAGDHRGVAEAVRHGWADIGVCVRLTAEEAGLRFLPVRDDAYDLCFPTALENEPRVRALIRVVRSAAFRDRLGELPGYNVERGGDVAAV